MSDTFLEDSLSMNWLRPENAVWEAVAARHISRALLSRPHARLAEIGIGNGYFTFRCLGGRFHPTYDWYYNVSTAGFADNSDIYDADARVEIGPHIARRPARRMQVAIDHKKNLIAQTAALDFVDRLAVADANEPVDLGSPEVVYSNMLYWLREPLTVLRRLYAMLAPGGEVVLVFPNPAFYEYCRSYRADTPFWRAVNRGRAESVQWTMALDQFETEASRIGFSIKESTRYLSARTLRIWDFGLRPVSPQLIELANAVSPAKRLEIKQSWCHTLMQLLPDLLAEELEHGPTEGGFNFVVLSKR
jgi:hypothetical protein